MTAVWILSLFMLGYFLRAPAMAAASVSNALRICGSALIPSIFPFLVLVGIMNRSGMAEAAALLIGKPIGALFGVRKDAAYVILLGMLGGFPIGAVCIRELYGRGALTREEAERLLTFTNNAGPAFCIGGIGGALFGDTAVGIQLFFCQLSAAILIGIFQRKPVRSHIPPPASEKTPCLSELLTGAVTDGGMTMLKICSFAVFFAVLGDAACKVAEQLCGKCFAAFVASLLELTMAARSCALLADGTAQVLAAFAVGFAGLSVHMQVGAVLSGSGIRQSRYLICKLAQGAISACIMLLIQILVRS